MIYDNEIFNHQYDFKLYINIINVLAKSISTYIEEEINIV